jgi:membrane-associated phospholipid phosphatase
MPTMIAVMLVWGWADPSKVLSARSLSPESVLSESVLSELSDSSPVAAVMPIEDEDQAPVTAQGDPLLLKVRIGTELWLALIGGGIAEGVGDASKPASCSWCTPPPFDSWGRSHLVWSAGRQVANAMSWATGYGVPGVLVFLANRTPLPAAQDPDGTLTAMKRGQDLALVAEAWAVNDGINQVVKHDIARLRPDGSDNLSFYSGHTSDAFAMVMALYTTHRLRHDQDAHHVLLVGLPFAAMTGYLRIAADKHYASDVLVGAAAGSAVGCFIPALHNTRFASIRPWITKQSRGIVIDVRQ